MLAFGIVAGAFDFVLAALLAEIAELLARHAQRIVHLAWRARALRRIPVPSPRLRASRRSFSARSDSTCR